MRILFSMRLGERIPIRDRFNKLYIPKDIAGNVIWKEKKSGDT